MDAALSNVILRVFCRNAIAAGKTGSARELVQARAASAGVRKARSIPFSSGPPYRRGATRNVILVRGAESGVLDQRVPVPIGMWRPFAVGSVPMNLAGSATLVVAGQPAAVLICYEQFIPWT